jgi:hypothetical protein
MTCFKLTAYKSRVLLPQYLTMWLRRLTSFFSRASSGERLSRADVELINLVRMNPTTPLRGEELLSAKVLASRGLLRSAGAGRFLVTEKAVAACRQPRG